MAIAHVTSFSTADISLTNQAVLTVPAGGVAAGNTILLATGRGDAIGLVGGLTSIVDSRGNTWVLNDAFSMRANVSQVMVSRCRVVTALQAGDTITVMFADQQNRKAVIAHVFSGVKVTSPRDATTGTTTATNVDTGFAGSSTTPTATTGATTEAVELVFGVVGAGVRTVTAGSGYTLGPQVDTAGGTSDRSYATEWRLTSSAGAQTVNFGLDSSTSWAVAGATYLAEPDGGGGPVETPLAFTAVTATGWTATGGTAQAVLADSNDATTLTSPNNPTGVNPVSLTLPAIEKPAGNLVVTVRAARMNSSSGSIVATLHTSDGTQIAGTGSVTVNPAATTPGDLTVTFPAASIDTEVTEAQWRSGTLLVRLAASAAA